MERNLDWFDYWMLGKTDSSPEKQEQYKRWERIGQEMLKMRQTRPCSNPKFNMRWAHHRR